MNDTSKQSQEEQDFLQEVHSPQLSWLAGLGAVAGLVSGIIIAILAAAAAFELFPQSQAAEVIWEIAAPLLSILGLIGGSFGFRIYLKDHLGLAVFLVLALMLIGFILAFQTVGFPWRVV
jgi:hypothetical protein